MHPNNIKRYLSAGSILTYSIVCIGVGVTTALVSTALRGYEVLHKEALCYEAGIATASHGEGCATADGLYLLPVCMVYELCGIAALGS